MSTTHSLRSLFSADSLSLTAICLSASLLFALLISNAEMAGGAQLHLQTQGFEALSQVVFGATAADNLPAATVATNIANPSSL